MNYNESETNTLVVSNSLARRHLEIYDILRTNCLRNGFDFEHIDSRNIWCRDFMPIQVGDQFIKFRYGYDKDNPQFPSLTVKRKDWNWLPNLKPSALRLDGGNIVRFGTRTVMTDIIFRHNTSYKKAALVAKLEDMLHSEVVIVPTEPGDDIGHTDGICHFTPDGRLLVGDYTKSGTKKYARYFDRLTKSLASFNIRLFPYANQLTPRLGEKVFRQRHPEADTFNPGFGYYINFLVVGHLLFLPTFGIEDDFDAIEIASECYPNHKIITVPCEKLSMEGGLLNCIGMTYKL